MEFEQDLIRGKAGEKVVYYMLTHNDKIKDVWDVSDDRRYQENDVDFLILTSKGQVYGVEVKTDFRAHETGNIFFETESHGKVGCLQKTTADYIYYYLFHNKKLYMINTEKLREFLDRKGIMMDTVKGGENSRGYLISIDELIRQKIATERDE